MNGSTNRAILKLNSNELHFVRHNISLKENKIFFLFSQIENQRFSTSLNNNIKSNSDGGLPVGFNLVEVGRN